MVKKYTKNHTGGIESWGHVPVEKSPLPVESSIKDINVLTEKQKKILGYLVIDFLTPKKISIVEKISLQRVYIILNSLQKKGFLNKNYLPVERGGGTFKPPQVSNKNHTIRVHGQIFKIILLQKNKSYLSKINQKLKIDDNTIMCYDDCIMVYSSKSFLGLDVYEGMGLSMDYFNHFFVRLESDLGVKIVKDRVSNISVCRCHISETNNEMAKDYNVRGEKLSIRAEDGRVWCLIDNSFNLNEMEFVHPKTSFEDSEKIISFMDDLRKNEALPNMSELTSIVYSMAKTNLDMVKNMNDMALGLKSVIKILEIILPKPEQELKKDDKKVNEFSEREKPYYCG